MKGRARPHPGSAKKRDRRPPRSSTHKLLTLVMVSSKVHRLLLIKVLIYVAVAVSRVTVEHAVRSHHPLGKGVEAEGIAVEAVVCTLVLSYDLLLHATVVLHNLIHTTTVELLLPATLLLALCLHSALVLVATATLDLVDLFDVVATDGSGSRQRGGLVSVLLAILDKIAHSFKGRHGDLGEGEVLRD